MCMWRFLFPALVPLALSAQALPPDVPPDHWASAAVGRVLEAGWMQGFPGGGFQGDSRLNRFQLATTLGRVLDTLGAREEAPAAFKDVKADHWAAPYLGRVVAAGLVQGFPGGEFRGTEELSRYQLAQVLARLLPRLGVEARPRLPTDVPPSHWAAVAVAQVVGLGWMRLDFEDRFQGGAPVTRYQLAYALAGLSQSLPLAAAPPPVPNSAAAPPQQPFTLRPLEGAAPWVYLGGGPLEAEALSADNRLLLLRGEGLEPTSAVSLPKPLAAVHKGWGLTPDLKEVLRLGKEGPRAYGVIGQPSGVLPRVFAHSDGSSGGVVALDPSGNYLALMNSTPLCLPDCASARSSGALRLVLLLTNPVGLYAEHAYALDAPGNRLVGLAWPKPGTLLASEQGGGKTRIYRLELGGATDLAFSPFDEPPGALEVAPGAGVRPVAKERVLELEGEYQGLACLGDRFYLLREGRVFEVVPGQALVR
ncbi:MAG: S-layer protein [Meiothermus sp.]